VRLHIHLRLAAIGTLSAALAGAALPAHAQAQTDSRLFYPGLDGNPNDPPRFRRPAYGNPPGSGAGTTGFVSTNKRRPKAKRPEPAVQSRALPPIVAPPPDATIPEVFRPKPPSNAQLNARAAGVPITTEILQRRVRRPPEQDPYGPLGLRAGAFNIFPAVQVNEGFDSNPGRIVGGKGSWFTQVAPEVTLKSDWSRHELTADLRGNYYWNDSLPNLDRPDLAFKANGRVDITSQTRADFEGRFALKADLPGNPNLPSDVSKPPLYTTAGATAGLTQRFNRLELTARGTFDRADYQDLTLNDGSRASQEDRNYTQYGGALRAAYELSPGFKPFVEGGVDTRKHDLAVDFAGMQRDSDGATIKGGAIFEFTRQLTGEFSVGQLTRRYKDPNLEQLRGLIADASLVWYASALTTVKLTAQSTVDESTIPGVSGVLNREVAAQVDHSFRRWLIGTVKAGYRTESYQGIPREDQRYTVSGGVTYKLSRDVQLKGEVRQEWVKSNVPGQDYTASIYLVGLRLQR
jgi:hypothetical protein